MEHLFERKQKQTVTVDDQSVSSTLDDDKLLEDIGYVPSFKREFSNLATVRLLVSHVRCDDLERSRAQISFAFSIMGLCSSVATTFNTPLLLGGPASVTWCWILGACMCFTLGASPRHFLMRNHASDLRALSGASIAEIVSAFPTCGGL